MQEKNTMNSFYIREAKTSDIDQLVKLVKSDDSTIKYVSSPTIKDMFDDVDILRRMFEGRLADETCTTYVAVDDENQSVIGTGYITSEGHLSSTYVNTPLIGVGIALYKVRMEKAVEQGNVQVYAHVQDSAQPLQTLLENLGFTATEAQPSLWTKMIENPKPITRYAE